MGELNDNATEVEITPGLARDMVAAQFPQWADLPVRRVEFDGWDNRTFRLGDTMTLRLPSRACYAAKVEVEQRWLPVLGPHLPLPIPTPLAMGAPTKAYPWPWSVYRWIEGENGTLDHIGDLPACARDLASFLRALQRIDATGGPQPGPHNFYRGGPLTTYDEETRQSIEKLGDRIDGSAATEVWENALNATWDGPPVWIHGDVAATNILVKDGVLCAVIDFGGTGVGDPSCDLTIAWTLFSGRSRQAFRETIDLDEATWARSRGWAIWKALITLVEHIDLNPEKADPARRVIEDVIAESN